ncbi:peptidoglycan-binding domain-containing protein [Pinisolibacter sp.]|uniref:peptidoglycan-binding domain-containing protein n=1 Tax=Pinisolibacter sp. TaxID=2172024 RepID=UPI002FDCCF9E
MTRQDRHGDHRWPIAAAALAAALIGSPTSATAQLPSARPTGDPARTMEAARLAYEALPLADRIDIQDGLVWTGDYSGALDGTFGRMTFEAITAYQTRHRFAPDGILTAPARKGLAETALAKKTAVGFRPFDDKATGIRIHLPAKLVGAPTKRPAGSRYEGRGGQVRIDTFAFPDGDLAGLFERMKAETPGRKVTYAVLRPDWFVISDESGGQHGYARFARSDKGIRGFVFTVDAKLAVELDRVVIATAGRFEPFPGAAAPTTTTPATPTPATPTPEAAKPAAPPSVAATASGLVVAPGKVLTAAAAVGGCRSLTVAGKSATVATTDAGGVATLSVTGGTAGSIRLSTATKGDATTVASGESGGAAAVVAVPGEVKGGRLVAALQRGSQGAPVLDATGALVGLVMGRPDEARAVAGLIPPAGYDLTTSAALSAAVTAAGATIDPATSGEPTTTGRLVAGWAGRIVAVECRR